MGNQSSISLTGIVGAGIMLIVLIASAAGVMQIADSAKRSKRPRPLAKVAKSEPSKNVELEKLRQQQAAELEHIRMMREQAADERARENYKNTRCLDGILFETVNGELSNVGRCD
ncbi:MAG: hypothetical protein KUL77_12050 [Thermomonas sp.]|uniref:hypothetical protein n=1 Tax=Thermomonas sp. TaxID=1971895 RepID=UPI001EB471E1|nr:hypothetical protein [Thermomonas sp.]MBV2210280.1 hypothetical protein [Thermomonas sp.]